MTPLRKLELGAGVMTFLIAIYLMRLTPDIGIIYGLPGALTGIGAYFHSRRRGQLAHFVLGVGVLGLLGVFVFLFLIVAFKRIDELWTFLNFALVISGLVTVFASWWTHSQPV